MLSLCLFFLLDRHPAQPRSVSQHRIVARSPLANAIEVFDTAHVTALSRSLKSGAERHLAKGVLTSWSGKPKASIPLLVDALTGSPSLSMRESEEGLRYLALAEALEGHYKAAFTHAERLLHNQHILIGNDLTDFVDQSASWLILAYQPMVRISLQGPAELVLLPNATHRIEAVVQSGQEDFVALFDTGAEMTIVSRSTLAKLGVTPLPGTTRDTGSSGVDAVVSFAILPELRLGSAAVFNLPVMIEEDASLVVGPSRERKALDMIVGESLLRKLGTFGIDSAHVLSLNQLTSTLPNEAVLVEVGPSLVVNAATGGVPRNFLLDTGATTTILTRSFFQAHQSVIPVSSRSKQKLIGIGGSVTLEQYRLPNLNLTLQHGSISLHDSTVLQGSSALDVEGLCGNLGRDIWSEKGTFQIDYHHHVLSF